jgi:hypothetical protein
MFPPSGITLVHMGTKVYGKTFNATGTDHGYTMEHVPDH